MLLDGCKAKLNVCFGPHVFTDEKQNGPFLFDHNGEDRYFSEDRWRDSFRLPELIRQKVLTAYCVPYLDHFKGESYFYAADNDFEVFFDIRKHPLKKNTFKLIVSSAYTLEQWADIPTGKAVATGHILSLRAKGTTYFQSLRQQKKPCNSSFCTVKHCPGIVAYLY